MVEATNRDEVVHLRMIKAATRQVENYIEGLPEAEQRMAEQVRELLFQLVPSIEERFSYRLPFYYYHGMFCYIHFDKTGLHLCFCRGKDLVILFPQLVLKNRASVASVTLQKPADFQSLELTALIAAAADWNKEAAAQKIPIIRKKAQVRS